MVEEVEDLALVLNVIDLFGLKDLYLLEYLGCEELAGLFVLHQPHTAEGA